MTTQGKEWIAYVNGEYVPQSEAKLSVFDHGVLYGDGIFDTWCTWNGYVFHLDKHIDRMYKSIHAFQINMPLSKDEFKKIVLKVVETNGAKNQYIKALVTRGVGPRPLLSPVGCKTSVVVFSRPYLRLVEPGKEDKTMREASLETLSDLTDQYISKFPKPINSALYFAKYILPYELGAVAGAALAIPVSIYALHWDPSTASLESGFAVALVTGNLVGLKNYIVEHRPNSQNNL